ncbi:hypothetical protein L207DRAFT_515288 [Hyaloscypha variabilis F]|uniref:Uncharacterized protein n=1 Tax=Hyaloscypha variabilis (strain UAMH 11265 / GT02V1 / F) TaxID=1149755 RepID=A0A2J6RE22_HYAVF|nr:hypothetical protein L207DRAFT_515288 [Hyaloscypha variabilis F]
MSTASVRSLDMLGSEKERYKSGAQCTKHHPFTASQIPSGVQTYQRYPRLPPTGTCLSQSDPCFNRHEYSGFLSAARHPMLAILPSTSAFSPPIQSHSQIHTTREQCPTLAISTSIPMVPLLALLRPIPTDNTRSLRSSSKA